MGFDVAVFGEVSLPERNVEEWLTAPVSAEAFDLPPEVGEEEALADTPEALLAWLGEVQLAPHEFLTVAREDGRLVLRGFVTDDTWGLVSHAASLLVASTAAFGGQGALTFSGYQGLRFGGRVVARAGQARFERLTAQDVAALERSPAFRALDEQIHARFDGLVGREPGPVDARRGQWSVNPFTGRKERIPAPAC